MKRMVTRSLLAGLFVLGAIGAGPTVAADRPDAESAGSERLRVEVCVGCHEAQYDAIRSGAHWMSGDPRSPAAKQECATCHGELEEHVLSAGAMDVEGLRTYKRASTLSAQEQNALCMGCHNKSGLMHWQGSAHDAEDVGCVGCHRMHGEDRVRSREDQQEVCFKCHAELRAEVNMPYTHPLREHKMGCSDCHATHGSAGDAELRTFSVNETCYSCHADKRGPFLWEHAPASENCVLCHSAHGSIHSGMLSRRQPHLCQSCHEPTAPPNEPLGPHARHSRLALSFRQPGQPDIGPNPLGSAGISRFVMGEACSNCHSKVHGTNHPAGAKLMR